MFVRFVIDEAHCFSAWGQDFRVDYLYIGDFIKSLMEKKNLQKPIPVSCFTATARQRVIEDICNYFKEKLSLELEVFRADASRTNLRYKVLNKKSEEEKYQCVRELLEEKDALRLSMFHAQDERTTWQNGLHRTVIVQSLTTAKWTKRKEAKIKKNL